MQDTRYGLLDYFQLSLWYVTFFASVYYLGWPGLIVYGVGWQVLSIVLFSVFGVEMMSGGDQLFFLDDHRSCMNIVTALTCERFKAESFRDQMFERSLKHPRIRSTVVKLFGKFMFK